MEYELALISVLVAGGYWGWIFVRQDALRTYGIMQLAAAALAGLGLIGRKLDQPELGVPGAIGVGAGACLLVLGPFVRSLARRLAAAERFGLADKLLDVAEVLAPGSGVADEKALLGAMREIRDGNIEQTVEALNAAKQRAPVEARLAIDERIAMLYLAAYRWDEAIAHAEAHLFGAIPPVSDVPVTPAVALRRALGLAPPVWVELLGAYGYKGDLDQAARMLARLEDACAGREDAAIWVHRGRLIFLALAGRVGAVETLVEPRRSRHMKPSARRYWIAVAHERHGDRAAAEAAYARARAGARGRPRALIEQALARLPNAHATELGPTAQEIAARVEAAAPPQVGERARPRGPWATRLVTTTMALVSLVIVVALGESNDVGVLTRAGAVVRGLVHSGEWWRLVSCMFVHVGGIHLLVNLLGLWFLGRFAEDLFGPWRMLVLFGCSGVAGAAGSLLASQAGVAAGASAAIFGLLGAVFIELTWHRRRHRATWNRGLWGPLALVIAALVGVGFLYPAVDQWAHGAGLFVGSLLGVGLSPGAPWAKYSERLARGLAIGFLAVVVFAAVMVARTSVADSLARAPLAARSLAGLTARVPATWQASNDELFDADLFIVLTMQRQAADGPVVAQLARYAQGEPERARSRHFDQVDLALVPVVQLPPGWQSRELAVSFADPLGGRQRYRAVLAARPDAAGGLVIATLYLPESVGHAAPAFFTALLASIGDG